MPHLPLLRPRRLAALACALCFAPALPAAAEPPAEDECPLVNARPGVTHIEDAVPTRLREGMVVGIADLPALRELFPLEIWRHRESFFHEGMRMEIGPCHRRYPVPSFYARATEEFAGRPRVDGDGNLLDYRAGLPFPPDSIDPRTRDAGVRWAWNLEQRYMGSGPIGSFRITDMPARTIGSVQTYRGTFFLLKTRHRADLSANGYAIPDADGLFWAAGGRFDEPFATRHLAWRQLRYDKALTSFSEPDDTFVYVPTMRKMRRASAAWVDGLYTPRYRVGGDTGGGGLATGGNAFTGAGGSINPTSAESYTVTDNLRRGFVGLAIRPNAYRWRILGQREVIAPLNGTREGYPREQNRNFGPSGLSVGSDRWEVRWAVVLMGELKEPSGEFQKVIIYVDYQTQQPLYWFTRRHDGREVDITIPVYRFSGDLAKYPKWPTGEKAYVFDPVATVSYGAIDGGTGWRRESYDLKSVPVEEGSLRKYTSTNYLLRGH